MANCFVEIDQLLRVKVQAPGDGCREMTFRFTPVLARKLADCLLEYSGAVSRSHGRRNCEAFPALLIEPHKPPQRATPVIHLGSQGRRR
jgi:hypothetical protein